MKLLRYGQIGHEKPGLLDAGGAIRDLSAHIADIDCAAVLPDRLARLAAIDPDSLPKVAGEPRLGAPIFGTGKFIAIGLNYPDHAAEAGAPIPTEPVVFSKATSCIIGPNDDIMLPKGSTKTDWEVELGVVIGAPARYVAPDKALEHVAGYLVVNDLSEREYQLERGGQWDKGKGCDTFGPIGPWLVTAGEVADPQALGLWLEVNGARMQTGDTRTMIFGVGEVIAHVSCYMTLLPGDIITTSTPPGVGLGMRPPVYLRAGDVVRLGIDGLGEQRQSVVDWRL